MLVDEDLGIGHAEAEGGIGSRQRGGVVLGVVVTGGDVETQVARGIGRDVIANGRIVFQQAVAGLVAGDALAVVDHGNGGRVDFNVTTDGRLTTEGNVRTQRQVLAQAYADVVFIDLGT